MLPLPTTCPIGINPRPASASRALLRLTPCHQTYRRSCQARTSGTSGSLELTGECDFWNISRFHVACGFPALRESNSFFIHLLLEQSYCFNAFCCFMNFSLEKIRNPAKDFETRSFWSWLQWMFFKERDNFGKYIFPWAYRVPIALTVILPYFFLEVDLTTIQCVSYLFEEDTISLLHFYMKMHLHLCSCSIGWCLPDIDEKTSLAICKTGNIITTYCRFCPSHVYTQL